MRTYIVRRLLLAVPTLLLISLVIFAGTRAIPGDTAEAYFADSDVAPDAEDVARIRSQFGLDRPVLVQYGSWLLGVIRFDFGESFVGRHSVLEEIGDRFPITLELAVLAMMISWAVAIPAGVLMATRQDGPIDYLLRFVTISGVALPTFWVGIIVLFLLVTYFNWFPPLGIARLHEDPRANVSQLIWPALVQGFFFAAILARMTRSALLEVLREDYIRTARAKGLSERIVLYRHGLRNAMLPVFEISSTQFGHMLGGTIIIETIFSVPGIGTMLVDSIKFRDYPTIQAIILLYTIIFLTLNLAVDLSYRFFDPRIKYA